MAMNADGVHCPWCGLAIERAEQGRCPHCGAALQSPERGTYALVEEPPTPAREPADPPTPQPRRAIRDFASRFFHESARRDTVLAAEIVALLALSLADLLTTHHLLRTHPKFYESNPIARLIFIRWNIAGMAIFKFSVVAFVVTVGEVVERKRPGLGRFVILTGCAASALVVAHGLRLAFGEVLAD
ncbi:DUF5658 family protein [Paludisphaera rhizosphaerae]|uniref:DUF5658 family protein n=1 Tax=Paludisphaera rhizosphaerae TaxID=2711216 RepID=UPI0013ECD3CA|nr:DUF5658 family protein [Paludisphaera rhizosphaerae]